MSLEETIKTKKKTINIRFYNKFVRFRWFTMLQNLRYFLNGNKKKLQFQDFAKHLNLTLSYQGLQLKKMLF